jgi:hypothetical protein
MDRAGGYRCGPVSRRSFLQIGSATLAGLGLSDIYRRRAEANSGDARSPATSVILVWLPGGPSHLETYDMKPDAPTEYRGEFRPIRTNVPGVDVCELLPMHAKIADRFTLLRSLSHDFSSHEGGRRRVLTGRIPKSATSFVNDAPAAGSVVAKIRAEVSRGVPNYISAVDSGRAGADVFAFGAAYLGPSHTPFEIIGDPNRPDFQVQNLALSHEMEGRLHDRRTLLGGIDRLRRDVDRSGGMEAMDRYNQMAFDLLTSVSARDAFDLSLEAPEVRERYGHHTYGQRTLLARRLVEAGSSFVSVVLENPQPDQPLACDMTSDWDPHAVNTHLFRDCRWRMPYYDQAITALIEDLYYRGLDKQVMLVVAGEFGRTPRLEYAVGLRSGALQPGRDHWPHAMSVLVSGGGMQMGQVIGSTNAKGEVPKDRPLTPNDLWATVYRHLGIDYTQTFLDLSGRPMPILPFGEPISELS